MPPGGNVVAGRSGSDDRARAKRDGGGGYAAMSNCKMCGKTIDHAQAAASLFDLSFLPVNGFRTSRREAKNRAAKVGPLCPKCLARRKDLLIEPRK
jgi:hypothetical protein